MNNYLEILRKAGWSLIIIGVIDIFWMIYCISNKLNYASSFNIFAVIAGIFLIKGSPKTALTTSFFSAFFIGGFLSVLVIFPFIMPIDFSFIYLRLYPIQSVGTVLFLIFFICYLFWIYKNLTCEAVTQFIDEKGIDRKSFMKNPRNGFVLGCSLVVILSLSMFLTINRDDIEKAKDEARSKVGDGYEFAITAFDIHSTGGDKTKYNFTVSAFNETEIKPIEVSWEK